MSCQFIPPYLLRRIVGVDESQSVLAAGQHTLQVDQRLRARRERPPGLRRLTALAAATDRQVIHSASNSETLPGVVVRSDGEPPSGDITVDEAYDSSGQVWNLFEEQFGRSSVDGRGTTLSVTVHYGRDYDNAFWDGTQLVFGDGDGVIFDRFTKPADVMAHEFAHGVTQFTAGLIYQGQSGALNESVSDVFAALAKQKALAQPANQANWLIGEGLFMPAINAKALRSMIEPGTAYDDPQVGHDPQVGSMADYVDTSDDNGGVHINSGIPNRAFALAAMTIGGFSWEKAGQVWYAALTNGSVTATTDFLGFAEATVAAATDRFPDDGAVAEAIRQAWTEVGVLGSTSASAPTSTPLPVAETVAVRRSGGFAGGVKAAELDLQADPEGPEIRRLLMQVNVQQITIGLTQPDRFVYTVEFGDLNLTVPEQDLTPELHRVVRLVLDRGGPQLGPS